MPELVCTCRWVHGRSDYLYRTTTDPHCMVHAVPSEADLNEVTC